MPAEQRIIDADRHVIEPIDMWRQYLPARWQSRAPRMQDDTLVFEGRPIFGAISQAAKRIVSEQARARAADLLAASTGPTQLQAMDRQGVSVGYLFPTYALYVPYGDDLEPALSAEIFTAYNRWLYDYCSADPVRLKGVGLIGPQQPEAMLSELARIARYGWRAVVLRPNPVRGRTLGDAGYARFWSACEDGGIAIAVHEGAQSRLPTAGAERFNTRFAQHACSHPIEQMMAFLALLEAGVLERHPRLKFAFLEAGAGWLAPWLWRLDELSYPHMRDEVGGEVARRPSQYFRRQCWISFEPSEPGLELLAERVGLDRLLYGSDYPHPDHGESSAFEQVAGSTLGAMAARSVLLDNPLRFYQG
jgi:predicted TIM-barrel fold metal-dependent hydrolase